uniref:Chitin-binding type-2 domain-containing protein n=4 Tax=Magallana gigas TaxID=29159 RepID=A0A8W8IIW2_MAGGI|nr:uncharacterized protein LOC105322631 isoform X7 [Crassostrea gigas]
MENLYDDDDDADADDLDRNYFNDGNISQSYDDVQAITPKTQPVSPSAVDFSKIHTGSPSSYNPGAKLDPSSLQTNKDSRTLGNGSIGFNKDREEITFSQEPYTPSERDYPVDKSKKKDDDDEQPKKKVRYMDSARFIIASVFIAVAIVAVVVVTVEYENTPDTRPRPSASSVDFQCILIPNDTTAAKKLKFNTTIEILCDYSEKIASDVYNSTLLMEFKPEYYLLQTQNAIEINHTLLPTTVQAGRWQISVSHPHRRIRILGDPVKCGGDGYFRITLIQKPNKIYPSDVNIQIESETSEVQLEVGQSEADGQYQITCSSTSDCTPAPITLLGSLGNKVVPLYGVNFTCIIKYNDYDGWSVSCTGSIPKSVVSSIDEITCRPILEDKKEADKTEAKVSKDVLLCNNDETCNFQCPKQNQDKYYSDPKFCNIFHRCVDERLYTAPCGKGTYFSTKTCACSHINDVIGENSCNTDGLRLKGGNDKELCDDSTRR